MLRHHRTLLYVMLIVPVMLLWGALIGTPTYTKHILHAKTIVLKTNLAAMRGAIQAYTASHHRPPEGLNELVDTGLLRSIPKDPITESADTWQVDRNSPLTDRRNPGITNVRSGAAELGSDGIPYSHY